MFSFHRTIRKRTKQHCDVGLKKKTNHALEKETSPNWAKQTDCRFLYACKIGLPHWSQKQTHPVQTIEVKLTYLDMPRETQPTVWNCRWNAFCSEQSDVIHLLQGSEPPKENTGTLSSFTCWKQSSFRRKSVSTWLSLADCFRSGNQYDVTVSSLQWRTGAELSCRPVYVYCHCSYASYRPTKLFGKGYEIPKQSPEVSKADILKIDGQMMLH